MKLKMRLVSAMCIAILAVSAVGCSSDMAIPGADSSKKTVQQDTKANKDASIGKLDKSSSSESVKMIYFVPTEDASGVTQESVEISADKSTPKAALLAMLKSDRSHKYPIFDKAIEISSVTVKDKVATVEVNKAFAAGKGGDLTVKLQLAAIVNTLTSFDDINSVLFVVDGKQVKSIASFDTSEPLTRMKNLIK